MLLFCCFVVVVDLLLCCVVVCVFGSVACLFVCLFVCVLVRLLWCVGVLCCYVARWLYCFCYNFSYVIRCCCLVVLLLSCCVYVV